LESETHDFSNSYLAIIELSTDFTTRSVDSFTACTFTTATVATTFTKIAAAKVGSSSES